MSASQIRHRIIMAWVVVLVVAYTGLFGDGLTMVVTSLGWTLLIYVLFGKKLFDPFGSKPQHPNDRPAERAENRQY